MPKIQHIKKARQRYTMVPVIDPETGQQKRVPTGRGGKATRGLTEPDMTKPLPPRECDFCRNPIEIGTPFKCISIKQQRGGITRYRHESCPNWNPWDYSGSLAARVAQIQNHEPDLSKVECEEDVTAALEEIVGMIRELAEEKTESADNIESGFGHEVPASEELREIVDGLESWADEIESVYLPELPEPEEEGGQLTEEQLEEWRQEVQGTVADAIGNCPV